MRAQYDFSAGERGKYVGKIRKPRLCRFCGQPMRPKGVPKRPDEYDHAQRCPYSRTEKCRGCGYTIAKGAGYCAECLCEEDGI